jgi:hypothetical protein
MGRKSFLFFFPFPSSLMLFVVCFLPLIAIVSVMTVLHRRDLLPGLGGAQVRWCVWELVPDSVSGSPSHRHHLAVELP